MNDYNEIKNALADAIWRPLGVVPESAKHLLSKEDIEKAKERYLKKISTAKDY